MDRSKLVLGIAVIVATLATLATIACYYLAVVGPHSALFYVNLSLSLLLEYIAIGAVYVVSRKKYFDTQNIASAYVLLRYVVVMAVVMIIFGIVALLYSGYAQWAKWYYIVLIVVTSYFVFRFIVVWYSGQGQKEIAMRSAAHSQVQKVATIDYNTLATLFQQRCKLPDVSVEERVRLKKTMMGLIDNLKTIPVEYYIRKEAEILSLNVQCGQLKEKVESLSKDNVSEVIKLAESISMQCITLKKS